MQKVFMLLGILIFMQTGLHGQEIPAAYQTRYYYRNHHPETDGLRPTPAIRKLLRDWVFCDSMLFTPESPDGYDSISFLTGVYSTSPFFIFPREISNAEYKKFPDSRQGKPGFPDTGLWMSEMKNEVYAAYYFQHPAYNDYPVCGVSQTKARAYCHWLGDSLNRLMQQKGIRGYKLVVDLPDEAQWQAMYEFSIVRPLKRNKSLYLPGNPSYLNFLFGMNGYRANFGNMKDARGTNLALKQPSVPAPGRGVPMPVKSLASSGGVFMLPGNMAEWTSTSCDSVLFNNKEYIYTVTGRLAPNVYEQFDSSTLKKYIRGAKSAQYIIVKGGSWNDDVYYLQPGAMRLHHKERASCTIGFRPVIRVVKSESD